MAAGFGGVIAGTLSEHDGIQQGIGPQAVAAVDADIGAFPGGIDAGNGSQPVNVGFDAAHNVVHPRTDRHRLPRHIHPGQVNADFPNLAQFFGNQRLPQVSAIQKDAAVDAVAGVDFRLLGPGHHIPGGQFHHIGGVLFHKAVAVLVPQVGPFPPGRLGQQHAAAGQSSGMILHHLHIHQPGSGIVSQSHAVPGNNQGVGRGFEKPAAAAGAENNRLGPDGVDLAGADFQGRYPRHLPLLHYQRGNEPLLVAADAGLDQLLEHHMEQGLAGEIAHKKGARPPLPAKGPGAQFALVVPVKGNPHVFHIDERLAGRAAHHLNGILVAQEIAALDGVIGVIFPIIPPVEQGGVDAPLSGVGMAAYRMNLADNGGVGAAGPGGDGRPHSGQPGADYQNIMLQHTFPFSPELPAVGGRRPIFPGTLYLPRPSYGYSPAATIRIASSRAAMLLASRISPRAINSRVSASGTHRVSTISS